MIPPYLDQPLLPLAVAPPEAVPPRAPVADQDRSDSPPSGPAPPACRFARDSPLEGTGFELPVPREIRFGFRGLVAWPPLRRGGPRRAAACDRSKLLPGAADGRGWSLILAFLPALLRDKVPLSRRPGNRTIDGKVGGNTESINSRSVNPATGCMLPIPSHRPLSMQPDLSIFSG